MVALVIFSVYTVLASLAKLSTPTKSELLKVLTTLIAASFAMSSRSPSIDPETSTNRMTFFAPDVAATYQGRNRGSYSGHRPVSGSIWRVEGYERKEPKFVPM